MIEDDDTSPFAATGHNGGPLVDGDLPASGWIRLYRDIRQHPIVGFGRPVPPHNPKYGSYSRSEAFMDLIMEAAWKPARREINGNVIELNVGQLVGALGFLAQRWNWSVQRVRTYIAQLIKENMLESNTLNNHQKGASKKGAPNVLTLPTYSKFQAHQAEISKYLEGVKQQAEQQAGNRLATGWQQAGNNNIIRKELKKDKKKKKKKVDEQLFDEETKQPINEVRAEANEAIDLYNDMARKHGWTCCRIRTNRIPTMQRRLKEIEGLENFKLALAEIPKNDFLSGRTPGKDGGPSFKMDIERLMSTKSNMGDVLATLIDRAGSSEDHPKTIQDVNDHVASLDLEAQRELVRKHANGVYPLAILGSPAGSKSCPMRQEVIEEFNLLEVYDELGRMR